MSQVEYFNPQSLAEALDLLELWSERAVIVNGGTDIVEKIACGDINPGAIIFIQEIPELKNIYVEKDYVSVGGAVTYKEIINSLMLKQFSALVQSASEIGSPAIRVLATPAGNIGTAVPAADCNVALIALDAEIVLAGKSGERIIPAREMFTGYCKTQLMPYELIKEIRFPVLGQNSGSAFLKIARRKAQDIAQVSVGVRLTVDGDVCSDIKIALGAVGPEAFRAFSLEKLVLGQKVCQGAQAVKGIFPTECCLRSPRNRAFKEAVVGVLAERAILSAYSEVAGGDN